MMIKNRIFFLIFALAALLISQTSSYLINVHLAIGESAEILPFLDFTHVRNHGGVFGTLQGKGWWFAGISFLILSGLVIFILKSEKLETYEFICFGIILGAGSSNILDRLIYGSVIDFINVQGIPYWHYVFNTADTLIHVGVWPMIFLSLFEHRKTEIDQK